MNLEDLLQRAERRPAPGSERREQARAAVHDAWEEVVHARKRRRRRLLIVVPALAAAAALIVALALHTRQPASAPASLVVARIVAVTGVFEVADRTGARHGSPGIEIRAGEVLRTGVNAIATLALDGAGEVRLNGDSIVSVRAAREFAIERGQAYFDSGGVTSHQSLTVRTAAGTIRDIGTRFEVRLQGSELRVRVRDGAVRVDSGAEHHDVTRGRELVAAAGSIMVRPTMTHGADWEWIVRATQFRLEGATLGRFLGWVEHEGGLEIDFADDALRARISGIVLHGSIEGLTVDDALATILPASGLAYTIDGGRVVIRRAAQAPR